MMTHLRHRRYFMLVLISACCSLLTIAADALELRGAILDYTGEKPVEEARVWVSHDRNVFTATTDAKGQFLIKGISAGKIEVVAMKSGHALGGKEGQLLGDDFITIILDKSRDLSIPIINSRYEPVNGARLKRLFINDSFTVNAEDLVLHGFPSIRSNAEGLMVVPNMPRFGYTSMAVTHSDYAEGILPTFPISIDREIKMMMVDGIKLRGRVANELGDGVSRARVAVAQLKDNQQIKFTEILTDSDGFYTVSVPPARYIVAAKHEDYAVGSPVQVWLRAGLSELIADIQLLTPHRIHGRTVLESGEPTALVQIAYRDKNGAVVAQSVSGRDGRFVITVPTGKGTLIVTPPERLMTVMYHEIPVDDIPDKQNLTIPDISLRLLPAITGIVRDRQGEPVHKAFVRTINADPPMYTQTDEAGYFQIQLESMTGIDSIQLYAEHPYRFLRVVQNIDLRNLEPQKLMLKSFRPKLKFMPELASNNLSNLLNESAPEWVCSDWFNLPDGKESVSLAALTGKIVVLTFWAGFDFDGKTRLRIDELNYLYDVFGQEDDIAFVTIHDASLKPFEVELIIRNWGILFPVGCDDETFTSFNTYKVRQIPQTVIIDPEGKLKYYEVEGRLHTLIKAMRR